MNIYINKDIKDNEPILVLIKKYMHLYTIIIESELSCAIGIRKNNCGIYIDFDHKPLFAQALLNEYQYIDIPKIKYPNENILLINIQTEIKIDEYYHVIDSIHYDLKKESHLLMRSNRHSDKTST